MGQYARDNSLNHRFRKMKVLLACLLSVGLSSGFELKHEATTRTLRADTLRDFPNECFAATQCKVYKQGETWPLTPFCGVSRCVPLKAGGLGEQITDCGRALTSRKHQAAKSSRRASTLRQTSPTAAPCTSARRARSPSTSSPPQLPPRSRGT